MATLTISPTSPLRPKRRSAPASTRADASQSTGHPSPLPPMHIPVEEVSSPSTAPPHLRPQGKIRHKALTIHTSEFPSPTSSPGHSPTSRPRPLPRVPDSACSEASVSFRPLPPTPATSSSTTFSPSVLQPEELPRRKESLRPLLTPLIILPEESQCTGEPATTTPVSQHTVATKAPRKQGGLAVINRDDGPISPATTVASVLVFRRNSESTDDEDDEEEDEALRRRRWRDTRAFAIVPSVPPPVPSLPRKDIPISLRPGAGAVKPPLPRESRHWYREERGQLVEQDYDQVLRSLRAL
jgi:hypothetical protein